MPAPPPPVAPLLVGADEAGLRVDAFLVKRALAQSAAAARRLLESRVVRIDGRRGKKGERLLPGQTIELVPAVIPAAAAVPPATAIALVVLHADAALVAVAKPPGVPTHPLRPGERGTLAEALLAQFPECAQSSRDPREAGFVHRLDVGTSGVVLAARNPTAFAALRAQMSGGTTEKIYLAQVVGHPRGAKLGASLIIDAPIGRRGRHGARVIVGPGGRGVLPARTEVTLLGDGTSPGTSLIEARLSSGRAHQVRAHLAALGAPLLGDRIYGDAAACALADDLGVANFCLHAWRLRVRHPQTGENLYLEAPPPVWAALRQET